MKKDFDAVVFDMDGVIFDSERIVQECWKIVADRHNIPDVVNTCTKCLGVNQQRTIEIFAERYGADFQYDKYKDEVRKIFYSEMYGTHLPLKMGVIELLTGLRENEISIGLASSTRRAVVEKELSDADVLNYFDVVICGDMVDKSKPEPDIFLEACAQLKVLPMRTYAVEDSYNGIRAASAGGLKAIMVPDLLQPDNEIREMCEAVMPSLIEVRDYLL